MYDIAYILKDTVRNPELKYSLRSVEENFPKHRVVFVGGRPQGLTPDIQIFTKQDKSKWSNGRENILKACECEDLSEDIYLFNDDFFVLQPMVKLPIYTNGELGEFIEMVKSNTGNTNFVKRLEGAYSFLLEENLPTKNYEVHVPMLINRKKMLDLVDKFPEVPCLRTLYGNYYQVPSIEVDVSGKMQDGVQQVDWGKINMGRSLVSTTDKSFKGIAGKQLKNKFPKPSKYERIIWTKNY